MNLRKIASHSPASQEPFELYHLLVSLQSIKPRVILEIGCDGGGSLVTWHEAFPDALLIGVEVNPDSDALRHNLNRIRLAGGKIKMIYADSHNQTTVEHIKKTLNREAESEIDFLFIDGDHTYKGVKRDFELYSQLVRPGGAIALHDTNARGIDGVEVDVFLNELDISASYKFIEIRDSKKSPGTRVLFT